MHSKHLDTNAMDEEDPQPSHFNNKLKPVSIDENGEPVYLLDDYLQHQIDEVDAEIDEVCAVFGECNDVECSYNKGYLKRQALYACHTCIPDSKLDVSKAAGVCLACSLHCHNGHDLVELYTKRNFRCDCGNSKFDSSCTLIPDKVPLNSANSYNQNFTGVYCTCARPYPDPDDDIEDDMISCALCEDWFHTRHLGISCPPSNSYEEMICEACVRKHDFLLNYDGLSLTKVDNTPTAGEGDVIVVESVPAASTEVKAAEEDEVVVIEQKPEAISDLKETAIEGSEEENLPQESLQATEDADDLQEISSEDVEMDAPEAVVTPQAERDDICDNLDDISRQCEEIDKAVDDTAKLEALAAATENIAEQSETEIDSMDTTEPADNQIIELQDSLEESVETNADNEIEEEGAVEDTNTPADAIVIEDIAKAVTEGNELDKVDEDKEKLVENKEVLKDEPKPSESIDKTLQDGGEAKRNCKQPKIKSTHVCTKFYESSRWRENLCICTDCTKLYTDNNVAYLLDPQDTLQFYKEFGREVYVEGAYGAFKRKIDSLPHTEKIFLAEEMAEFKDKFGEFLKQFADDQRVITSEDVRTFFGNLDQSRKRRKVEMESNYYCR